MNGALPEAIRESFERLEGVQTALQVLRRSTGLRVAVVAHVTETSWIACAVLGETSFGLKPGDALPLDTTFCNTVRCEHRPLLITNAALDPRFVDHPARSLYGVESYIAVPIHRRDGRFFGVLCALDAEPAQLTPDHFEIFQLLANLIAFELEAVERQKQQEVALRALEDFIAIAAHDLRQPLTTVLGRAELLVRQIQRDTPAPTLLASVTTLLNQTRRAVQLSETVLDMAQIEAGSFALDRAECDLVVLVRNLLDEVRTTAAEYTFVIEAPAAVLMQIDENRMRQALRNLVDNAVKYTPADAGPITIHIEPTQDTGAQIRVADHGSGVPADELPLLFTRRYRASNALGRGTSGSGLGLYIVRTIVEAHGGTIRAELATGGGLVFIVTLCTG